MKPIVLTFAIANALFIGAVHAAAIEIEVPSNVQPADSTLTRAEVLADFHIWRLAGLQELNQGERPVNTSSYEYRRAYATYLRLHASPQFATLVEQLQERPNASVVATRPGYAVTQSRR